MQIIRIDDNRLYVLYHRVNLQITYDTAKPDGAQDEENESVISPQASMGCEQV